MNNIKSILVKLVNDHEAEILMHGRDFDEKFRVVLMNPTHNDAKFSIALPWGRDFSQAYKWQWSFPVRYGNRKNVFAGRTIIAQAFQGHSFYAIKTDDDRQNVVDAIYNARSLLLNANREVLNNVTL